MEQKDKITDTSKKDNVADTTKTENSKKHAMILGAIGIVLFIAGILIASIHGNPLRGSGLGTISIIAGIVLLVIAGLRAFYKRAK
jgi:uncharacterized membrane protein